jgi:hypothetical protein
MSYVTNGALRENEAKSGDVAAAVRVAHTIEPQERKREAAFHGVGRLSVWDGEDGDMGGASPKKGANVTTGNGMLEVRRGSENLDRLIGKSFGEEMAEEFAKCIARQIPDAALELEANKFKAVWLAAAETFHGERQALIGMIGDGQNAPRQIVILGPQMQERLLRDAAHFPGQSREGSDAAAVLANLDRAVGGELLETRLQFGGEVHAEEYKTNT